MSIISRITTWSIGQVLKAADLNGEFNNITNLFNNLDAGTTSWTNVKTGILNVTGTATLPFGPFQAVVQATTTTVTSITSNAFSAATNMTASITPTSASHRIRVTMSGVVSSNSAGVRNYVTIKRGSTNIGDATQGFMNIDSAGGVLEVPFCISYIDSPATTSATTYALFFRNSDNASSVSINIQNNTGVVTLEEIV